MKMSERVEVHQNILDKNERIAEENRSLFEKKGIFVFNVMSSPGAGKTTFLVETIKRLKDKYRIGVIEGDVSSKVDAERIASTGVPVVQVNTGGACHLDASMIQKALTHLPIDNLDVLIIENVGNLVCPAEWRLGENLKVVLLSIPEGDDKPIKYPLMFSSADILLLTKIDLFSYFNFNIDQVEKIVRGLNSNIKIMKISSITFEGFDEWLNEIERRIEEVRK
ncbi:MAG: hydrogenase nickel incorporation protein HypB [Actinobacteria bacterium]|nr:hydrogenase nickel incorporation protein HypB [Actinomycetota bacterium]